MKLPAHDPIRGIIPVNRSAGRLRFILAVLLIFILWTLIAQSQPDKTPLISLAKTNNGFTDSIISEMIAKYFSLRTLILTSIPIVLLTISRSQISSFLASFFSEINDNGVFTQFLNICAFSWKKYPIRLTDLPASYDHHTLVNVQNFGGPAEITASRELLLLTESSDQQTYKIIIPNPTKTKKDYKYTLPHQEKITAVIPYTCLSFEIKVANFSIRLDSRKHTLLLLVDIHVKHIDHVDQPFSSQDISVSDGWFLQKLSEGNPSIKEFIKDEIERFYRSENAFVLEFEKKNAVEQEINHNAKARLTHKNYAAEIIGKTKPSRVFTRPHRRSLYAIHSGLNEFVKSKQEEITTVNVEFPSLIEHIQNQVVSFFNTSNIIINLSKKEI